jgi:glycosyltransferase involved in cell wall biosynthesis
MHVPGAAQRETKGSAALQNRDRSRPWRSRLCGASLVRDTKQVPPVVAEGVALEQSNKKMDAGAHDQAARGRRNAPVNWLILSHAFNMDGRAASQTITDKIPYLLKQDIQLNVISAVTGEKDTRFPHRQLLPWGAAGLRFDFRHWLAQRIGRGACYRAATSLLSLVLAPFIIVERLALGLSSQWSWSIPAALCGGRMVKAGSVQLVYSTGGAWSAHLAGWWIKKMTSALWIAEIHDPLVAPDQKSTSRESKAKRWLEQKICSDADLAWWFTDAALASVRRRNPQLKDKGFAVLAGAAPPRVVAQHVYSDTLHIGYFGVLSSSRSLVPFIEALAALCAQTPQVRRDIRLHVYGSRLDKDSIRAANNLGLTDMIIAHGRIEKDEASGLSGRDQIHLHMQRSDALLLLHGLEPACSEYIPSKLYEYLWTGRPVLALTDDNLQLDALIREHAGYVCHAADQKSIVQGIRRLWKDWKERKLSASTRSPVHIETTVATILQMLERVCLAGATLK